MLKNSLIVLGLQYLSVFLVLLMVVIVVVVRL